MMARIDTDGWELESALERHERFPETFWIPSKADRERLPPGHAVKLIFRIRDAGGGGEGEDEVVTERMWVYVTGRSGDLFEGRLQNVPRTRCGLAPGTPVRFLAEHVADIDHPPDEYDPR